MTYLEKLKIEQEIVENLGCIPLSAKGAIKKHIEREIAAIVEYGSDNFEVKTESLERIKRLMSELGV